MCRCDANILRASNIEARLKTKPNGKVHMVSGMKAKSFGDMAPRNNAPEPRPFRYVDYCSSCYEVQGYRPEVRV